MIKIFRKVLEMGKPNPEQPKKETRRSSEVIIAREVEPQSSRTSQFLQVNDSIF